MIGFYGINQTWPWWPSKIRSVGKSRSNKRTACRLIAISENRICRCVVWATHIHACLKPSAKTPVQVVNTFMWNKSMYVYCVLCWLRVNHTCHDIWFWYKFGVDEWDMCACYTITLGLACDCSSCTTVVAYIIDAFKCPANPTFHPAMIMSCCKCLSRLKSGSS